jgi:glutathione S-transferase
MSASTPAAHSTPEFHAMNPHGRIPVIDDGGTVVWESHTTLSYLSAKYRRDSFWREDPAGRSQADRWMDWSQATLQRDFMDLFWSFYRTPEAQRDLKKIDQLVAQCAAHYRLLDNHLAAHAFLAGDSLTMGDIPAGTSLYRYFELDIERPAIPNVPAWYERLRERAPYRQHVMIPFDDLRGRLDY